MDTPEDALNPAQSDPLAVANATETATAEVEVERPSGAIETAAVSNAAARFDDLWPEIVSLWLSANIHNSPVAQSTGAYNHLLAALPALRQAITEKL
jgi:hypothetical protein